MLILIILFASRFKYLCHRMNYVVDLVCFDIEIQSIQLLFFFFSENFFYITTICVFSLMSWVNCSTSTRLDYTETPYLKISSTSTETLTEHTSFSLTCSTAFKVSLLFSLSFFRVFENCCVCKSINKFIFKFIYS